MAENLKWLSEMTVEERLESAGAIKELTDKLGAVCEGNPVGIALGAIGYLICTQSDDADQLSSMIAEIILLARSFEKARGISQAGGNFNFLKEKLQ